MKIVIDIDENVYTRLFDNCKNNLYDMRAVCYAVRKGTVIPSGHGDLIDRQALLHIPYEQENYIGLVEWYDEIVDAHTIIPADKEAKE